MFFLIIALFHEYYYLNIYIYKKNGIFASHHWNVSILFWAHKALFCFQKNGLKPNSDVHHQPIREGLKKRQIIHILWISDFLPPPPYPHQPKLIIFTLRIFYPHPWTPSLCPYPCLSKLMRFFFFFYLTFLDFFLLL